MMKRLWQARAEEEAAEVQAKAAKTPKISDTGSMTPNSSKPLARMKSLDLNEIPEGHETSLPEIEPSQQTVLQAPPIVTTKQPSVSLQAPPVLPAQAPPMAPPMAMAESKKAPAEVIKLKQPRKRKLSPPPARAGVRPLAQAASAPSSPMAPPVSFPVVEKEGRKRMAVTDKGERQPRQAASQQEQEHGRQQRTGQEHEEAHRRAMLLAAVAESEALERQRIRQQEQEQLRQQQADTSLPEAKFQEPPWLDRQLGPLPTDPELELVSEILTAMTKRDVNNIDLILTNALKSAADSASRYHSLSLLFISKKVPEAFFLPRTYSSLLELLRPPPPHALGVPKRPAGAAIAVLAARLLFRTLGPYEQWPVDLVRVYLEDFVGPRTWVDHWQCKSFVMSITTALPGHENGEKEEVKSRYGGEELRKAAKGEFVTALNAMLSQPGIRENPRHLIRLLQVGCGYEEVRAVASSMLEGWLNNLTHARVAKELLERIVSMPWGSGESDLHAFKNILALRIRPQAQPATLYTDTLQALIRQKREFSRPALRTFLTAELQTKAMQNLRCVAAILKALPPSPPPEAELAVVLQELAATAEARPQLRHLARRLLKVQGLEINVHALCRGLMQGWAGMEEQPAELKAAWLAQLEDLVCHLLLAAAAPFAVEEAPQTGPPQPAKASAALRQFRFKTATVQMEAMAWCTDVVMFYLPGIEPARFTLTVRRLLFLEGPEAYASQPDTDDKDSSADVSVAGLRVLAQCMPVAEETLTRVLLMGIAPHFHLQAPEALAIIERLLTRAAGLQRTMDGALTAENPQLPAAIFKLASFSIPGIVQEPLLQLVVRPLFWKASLAVVLLGVFNPETVGAAAWDHLPTVRCLMQALLTNSFTFPPTRDPRQVAAAESAESDAAQRDSSTAFALQQHFTENLNAAQAAIAAGAPPPLGFLPPTIDWAEWGPQLMVMTPEGPARKPPPWVWEELQSMDQQFKLGNALRASRQPDFLAHVTAHQSAQESWAWLKTVLAKEPEAIAWLPSKWQVELLFLHERGAASFSLDVAVLHHHLRELLQPPQGEGKTSPPSEAAAVVSHLAARLAAPGGATRARARRCLACIVSKPKPLDVPPKQKPVEDPKKALDTPKKPLEIPKKPQGSQKGEEGGDDLEWLGEIEVLTSAKEILPLIVPAVRKATLKESSPEVVLAYLKFLQRHATSAPLVAAQLILQRPLIARALLLPPGEQSKDAPLLLLSLLGGALGVCLSEGEAEPRKTDTEKAEKEEGGLVKLPPLEGRKESVTVQSEIVQAAVEVVALLASERSRERQVSEQYELLRTRLFHGGCLVEVGGRKGGVVLEKQAELLVLSGDELLVKAGLAALSPTGCLSLLSEVGHGVASLTSAECSSALLARLESLDDEVVKRFCEREVTGGRIPLEGLKALEKQGGEGGKHLQGLLLGSAVPPEAQPLATASPADEHPSREEVPEQSRPWEDLLAWLTRGKSDPELQSATEKAILELRESQSWSTIEHVIRLATPELKESSKFALEHLELLSELIRCLTGKLCEREKGLEVSDDFHELVEGFGGSLCSLLDEIVFEDSQDFSQVIDQCLQDLSSSCEFSRSGPSELSGRLKVLATTIQSSPDQEALEVAISKEIGGGGDTWLQVLLWAVVLGQVHEKQDEQPSVESSGKVMLNSTWLVKLLASLLTSTSSRAVQEALEVLDPDLQVREHLEVLLGDGEVESSVKESMCCSLLTQGSWRAIMGLVEEVLGKWAQDLQPWKSGLGEAEKGDTNVRRFERVVKARAGAVAPVLEFLRGAMDHPRVRKSDSDEWPASSTVLFPLLPKKAVSLIGLIVVRMACEDGVRMAPSQKALLHMAARHGREVLEAMLCSLVATLRVWGDISEAYAQQLCTAGDAVLLELYRAFPKAVAALLPGGSSWSPLGDTGEPQEDGRPSRTEALQESGLSPAVLSAMRLLFRGTDRDMTAAYGVFRELCVCHPSLVLPHLPTLAALLRDQVHELQKKAKPSDSGPLAVPLAQRAFSLVLGAIDGLRPHIVQREAPDSLSQPHVLEPILGAYLSLLQSADVSERGSYSTVVAQLADLLCHCAAAEGRARAAVSAHKDSLETVGKAFPGVKKLNLLLRLLGEGGAEKKAGKLVPPAVPVEQVWAVRQRLIHLGQCTNGPPLAPFGREWVQERNPPWAGSSSALDEGGEKEEGSLLAVLADVDRASARMPAVLPPLEGALILLTAAEDGSARDASHVLLDRLLLHHPSASSTQRVGEALLQRLRSRDVAVARGAARQAARFFHHCPDLQEALLTSLLQLGRVAQEELQQLIQALVAVYG